MEKRSILIIGALTSFILLVSTAYTSYFFFQKSKEFYVEANNLKKELLSVEHSKNKLLNYEKMSFDIMGLLTKIDQIELISEKDENSLIEVTSLGMEDTLILFFYSDLNCDSCIDAVFGEINWMESNKNLRIIADYNSKRDLINFKRRSDIDQEVFRNGKKLFADFYQTYPLFVVFNGNSKSVFFPEKNFQERTISFLDRWNLN